MKLGVVGKVLAHSAKGNSIPLCCILLLCITAQTISADPVAYQDTVLGVNPRGYWRLGEAVQPTANDAATIDGAQNGQYQGGVQVGVAGAIANDLNTAVAFGGVDSLVLIDDDVDPVAYTIAAWVKPSTIRGQTLFVRTVDGRFLSESSHTLYMEADGRFGHYLYDGTARTQVGSTLPSTGEWYFVVGVAENNGEMKLYVNGVEEGGRVSIGQMWIGGNQYGIGAGSWKANLPFHGTIDEVALFHHALDGSAIARLHGLGRNGGQYLPQRITFDPGNERFPVWDPSSDTIAFSTDRTIGRWNDLGGVQADGSDERILATGLQSGFGLAPWRGDWIGTSGRLAVMESAVFHEILSFNPTLAPFTRTQSHGNDAAFEQLLIVDGGGGSMLFRASRDGSTALWRFSEYGGGGPTSIRTAPLAWLDGDWTSSLGKVHITENTGSEHRYVYGGTIAPDGSVFILAEPCGSGHDLFLYETATSARHRLTHSGRDGGAWNTYPDISPDGQTVAYACSDNAPSDIYLINIAGGTPLNLTASSDYPEAWPSWSGDGSRIAYGVYDNEASWALAPGEQPNWNIHVQQVAGVPATGPGLEPAGNAGSGETAPRITSGLKVYGTVGSPLVSQITASNGPTGFSAVGLPPGLTIAAATGLITGTPVQAGSWSVELSAENAHGHGTATLLVILSEPNSGQTVNCLAYAKLTSLAEDQGFIRTRASRDGSRVTWANGFQKIFTMNGDGSGLTMIYDGDGFSVPFLDISADGSKVIWTWGIDGIHIANFDGSNQNFIAANFLNPHGGNGGPEINTNPRLNADGSKVYFTNSIRGGWDMAMLAGLWEIQADGSGMVQRFNYPQMANAVFGTDGSEYNGNITFESMDMSDDGTRFIFSSGQNGGGVFTWGGTFRKLSSIGGNPEGAVTISGDGRIVAYRGFTPDLHHRNVMADRFEGGTEQLVASTEPTEILAMDYTGSLLAIGASRLTNPFGGTRIDLQPDKDFWGFDSRTVSLSGNGRTLFAASIGPSLPWPAEIWAIKVNPSAPELAGFPGISNPQVLPKAISIDGTEGTVVSADIQPTAEPLLAVKVSALREGEFSDTFRAPIYPGFHLTDDGLVNDEAAGDLRFTSGDIYASVVAPPTAGMYTQRITATEQDRILARDYDSLRVYEGELDEQADSDGDGVVTLLEKAFGGDPETPDTTILPRAIVIPGTTGNVVGVVFQRQAGGYVDASGDYHTEDLTYRLEISTDLQTWTQPDEGDISVVSAPLGEGMESSMLTLPEDFLATHRDCFIRIKVTGH